MVQFNGGFVNYQYNYRSAIDTPFKESSIGQHLLTGSLNVTVASSLPLTITYFERQSNSQYFRDYRDIRVELNGAAFRQLQARKLASFVEEAIDKLKDPLSEPLLDYGNKQLTGLNDWLEGDQIVNRVIQSRITVLNTDTLFLTPQKDSAYKAALHFLRYYDTLDSKRTKMKGFRDSLEREVVNNQRQISALRKLLNGGVPAEAAQEAIEAGLQSQGVELKRVRRLFSLLSSVQTLAVGKVVPNHSELTLRNININGINFEYYKGIYLAFSAGAIDYRARDFFYTGTKRRPQFVYLARIGYGQKAGSHAYLTAFRGKKQLLNTRDNPAALTIYGMSLEAQLLVTKNHRLLAEVAQSAAPDLIASNGTAVKPSFRLGEKENKAYSVKWNSFFPATKTRVEGFYRYRGLNFQSFSSYYTNASLTGWQLKADQYLWKRQLRVNLAIVKNDFENDMLPVRYNGSSTFKSFSLFFKRKKLPTVQLSYMPTSQLSQIGGQVYENFYHSLNGTASHYYKIGLAKAVSVLSYSRFFNDSRDSGFIYYNARNVYLNQHFDFLSYSANLNITRSSSMDYTLTIVESGVSAKILKRGQLGFGVKINQLENLEVRTGFYGNGRLSVPKLGEFNAWLEKSWLPGWKAGLVENAFYNIGFTRFFN